MNIMEVSGTRGSDFYGDFVIYDEGDGHLPVDISESHPFPLAIGGINEDGSISLSLFRGLIFRKRARSGLCRSL
jgi:hypothetical protein